jgi:prefoldin subunit 5
LEKSIDLRALVPLMMPSDTSNLSGFEQLNEIKTDRDEYVNLLQNEIDSKEDHIKELNEKLKQAQQNLMLLSEKRESLSQNPSQASVAKSQLKQTERDILRKTQNEEEFTKNIEAIRSVDQMMNILMDKIQSIKELAKTLQEEIDWLRIKNFEIMERELYLKENL